MDIALSIKRTPEQFEAVEAYFSRGLKAAKKHGVPFMAGLAVPIVSGLAGGGAALILRNVPQELWPPMAWAGLWGACVAVLLMLLVRPGIDKEEGKENLARQSFLSGRKIFLGDRGVIEAGDGWQNLTYWHALSAMVTLPEGYLLEREDENGIFVPYTAFQDDSSKGSFLIYIDQHMKKSARPSASHEAMPPLTLPPPPPDEGPIVL